MFQILKGVESHNDTTEFSTLLHHFFSCKSRPEISKSQASPGRKILPPALVNILEHQNHDLELTNTPTTNNAHLSNIETIIEIRCDAAPSNINMPALFIQSSAQDRRL